MNLAGELEAIAQNKSEEKFSLRRDSNPGLPSWALLLTELLCNALQSDYLPINDQFIPS